MPETAPESDFEWHLAQCAHHEAGHAVAYVSRGLAIKGAYVFRSGRDPWSIHGQVIHIPRQPLATASLDDIEQVVVATFSGMTAEAIWMHRVAGTFSAGAAQRRAEKAACDYDIPHVRPLLRRSRLSYGSARTRARRLVLQHWRGVQRVAHQLQRIESLSEADVRRLI